MRSILLGFIVFLFVACGSSTTKEDIASIPESPVVVDKSKTPPEIPKI